VQDADRLDAIGAIGIFRVSAYSGAKGRPLYHPDLSVESSYSHFFEKLLKLPNWMKTDLGKAVAKKRIDIMEKTVALAKKEYELEDFE
jgi:uncharacterized protein